MTYAFLVALNLNTSNINKKPFYDEHFPSILLTFWGATFKGKIEHKGGAILKAGKQKHDVQKPILSSPLRCREKVNLQTVLGI